MTRPNPYSLAHLWSDETLAAYQAMPLCHGHTVALDYVLPKELAAQEEAWREWCRTRPRHLWPTWLDGWKDRKAMRGRA